MDTRRWLWNDVLPFFLSKERRENICRFRKKHLGNWMGIRTLQENGDGHCALCGWGAWSRQFHEIINTPKE